MSDDDAFVAAVTESPDDTVLRLVYADWLDERDDPRGRFLRLEVEAVQCGTAGPQFHALRWQLAEIARTIDNGWRLAVSRVAVDPRVMPALDWSSIKPVEWLDASSEWLDEQIRQQLITEDQPRQEAGRRWVWAYFGLLLFSLLFLCKVASLFVAHPTLIR